MAAIHKNALVVASNDGLRSADLSRGLVITCGHDATPRTVSFGVHAPLFMEFAKYAVMDKETVLVKACFSNHFHLGAKSSEGPQKTKSN